MRARSLHSHILSHTSFIGSVALESEKAKKRKAFFRTDRVVRGARAFARTCHSNRFNAIHGASR